MSSAVSFCGISLLLLGMLAMMVSGGHHHHDGIVDDEIWSHVFKVLSDTEHGKKIIVGHPEPAHLVDAYTKVYHHEPFGYHDDYHRQPHHHHHQPAPIAYHGHGHHGYHHAPQHHHHHAPHHYLQGIPLPLHHGPAPHHHHPHHHHDNHGHHAGPPEPVFRLPIPIAPVLDTYGPPHLHRHHKK